MERRISFFRFFLLLTTLVLGSVATTALAGPGPAVKEGTFYRVEIQLSREGDSQKATITVTGKAGYHCNKLYPWKLTVAPPPGVTVAKPVLGKADARVMEEAKVVFVVPFSGKTGTVVPASLKLSLCDDKQCQMETVELTWKVL